MKFDYRLEYQKYRDHIRGLIREGAKKPLTTASLALVGTLLFVAFLTLFALKPTLITISKLWREMGDEKEVIIALDKKIEALNQAKQNLQKVEGKMDLANSAIPQKPQVEEFFKQIELLAGRNQLKVITFSQAEYWLKGEEASPGAKKNITALPVTLTIGGDEKAVRTFMGELEKIERLTVIKEASLEGIKPESRQQQPYPVTATLNINIFYQKR